MKKLLTLLSSLLLTFTCLSVNYSEEVNAAYTQTKSGVFAQVTAANTIEDKGEANLGTSDIVTINGVQYYVLRKYVSNGTKYAELITKNVYNQRFNTQTNAAYYSYASSALKTYMDSFYTSYLANSAINDYIQSKTVTSYTSTSIPTYPSLANFNSYDKQYVAQKVYALDAQYAQTYASKFK